MRITLVLNLICSIFIQFIIVALWFFSIEDHSQGIKSKNGGSRCWSERGGGLSARICLSYLTKDVWISNNDEQCLCTSNCYIEPLGVAKKPNGVTNVRTNQWGIRTDLLANEKKIEVINERVEKKIDKAKWYRTVANDYIDTACTTAETNRKNLRCLWRRANPRNVGFLSLSRF